MIVIEIILEVLLIIFAIFVIMYMSFYMSFIVLTPETMTFKEANKLFVKYTKIFFGL